MYCIICNDNKFKGIQIIKQMTEIVKTKLEKLWNGMTTRETKGEYI